MRNAWLIEPVSDSDKELGAGGPPGPPPQEPLPVKFIHEKGPQYRTYHADAAWAAVNGQANIQLEFYLEHPPFPTVVVQPVNTDATYTGEMKIEGLEDKEHFVVIRDFQVGVVLSLQSAIQLQTVLGKFIDMAKEQQQFLKDAKK